MHRRGVGGAVLGALLGGKNNRGSGALIGGGIGGAACAAIMAAAKRKDRILAAQRAAAAAGTPQWASFQDEGGQAVQLASRTQDARIEGKILPVRYEQDGQKMVSPDLGEGPRQCRYVSTEMTGAQTGTAALPNQLFCRTSEGSWEPYATA